jgi:hypothetical protein
MIKFNKNSILKNKKKTQIIAKEKTKWWIQKSNGSFKPNDEACYASPRINQACYRIIVLMNN